MLWKNVVKVPLALVIVVVLFAVFMFADKPLTADSRDVTIPSAPIAESEDFATLVLGDPWDMHEFSDISQYINEAGERTVVANPTVSDGLYSGRSLGDINTPHNGWFFVLFPGYETAVHVGKMGSRYPIKTSDYSCVYFSMKVDSPSADQHLVYWFGDERLNTQGAPYGASAGYPSAPGIWKLYKIDLANTDMLPIPNTVHWKDRAEWQGLRIDPTIQEGVEYAVDWVRLTSCESNLVPIRFTPDAGITAVWLKPKDTNRRILVATDVDGASGIYNLDVQGVEAGEYQVGLGSQTECCNEESSEYLTINQTPIVKFVNPTWYSGEDFATTSGNAWDMTDESDIRSIECVSDYGFENGELRFITPPNTQQPSECVGPPPESVADPKIFLNMPNGATIDPNEYRYMTFRIFDAQPWQRIPRGSMIRWIWTVQGDSNRPGFECHLVSQDVPFDVEWNTYTVDLWDAFAGGAEEWAGECDSLPKNWRGHNEILKVRFDPSENITSEDYNQRIDWLRVTKPNMVSSGDLYPLGLNKFFAGQEFDVNLYYTTNPATQPKQNAVVLSSNNSGGGGTVSPTLGDHNLFLPLIAARPLPTSSFPSDLSYLWDTTGVAGGEYYICAEVTDNLNTAIFCSLATITVTP